MPGKSRTIQKLNDEIKYLKMDNKVMSDAIIAIFEEIKPTDETINADWLMGVLVDAHSVVYRVAVAKEA